MSELAAQAEHQCDMSCRNELVADDAATAGALGTDEIADLFALSPRLEDEKAVPAKGSDFCQVYLLGLGLTRKITNMLTDLPSVVPEFATRDEKNGNCDGSETRERLQW